MLTLRHSTVIISIIRIRYLKLFDDFTWENTDSSLWSIGELSSAITCACLPTLRPLLSRYFPSLGTQAARSTGYHQSGRKSTKGNKSQNSDPESGMRSANGHGELKSVSAVDGSEVELATTTNDKTGNPFETHSYRASEDIESLNEPRNEVPFTARAPGVGVKTVIKPAAAHQPEPSYDQHDGVQVHREVYQVRSSRRA